MTYHAAPDLQAYVAAPAGAHATYRLQYHLVWSVKARRRVLVGAVTATLQEDLVRTAAALSVTILALHIEPEHVHVLLSVPPDHTIARVVGRLKGASAHTLRARFPVVRQAHERSLWTAGYFARTLGDVSVAQVKAYLDRQTAHHA